MLVKPLTQTYELVNHILRQIGIRIVHLQQKVLNFE